MQLYEELLEEIAEINQRILEALVCAPSEQINRYTALIGAEIKFFRALHRDLDQAVP